MKLKLWFTEWLVVLIKSWDWVTVTLNHCEGGLKHSPDQDTPCDKDCCTVLSVGFYYGPGMGSRKTPGKLKEGWKKVGEPLPRPIQAPGPTPKASDQDHAPLDPLSSMMLSSGIR